MNRLRQSATWLGLTLLLCACNSPAWPERDGRQWLKANGFDEPSIARILRGDALPPDTWNRLARSGDVNVLFLLGRNPNVPPPRLRKLAVHTDEFVRSGAARNPALPPDVVALLRADASHTVWTGLAANPGLDADTLLAIQREKKMSWSWFAMNPACPPEVEAAIRAKGDASAVRWLERTKRERRGWPIERKPGKEPRKKPEK